LRFAETLIKKRTYRFEPKSRNEQFVLLHEVGLRDLFVLANPEVDLQFGGRLHDHSESLIGQRIESALSNLVPYIRVSQDEPIKGAAFRLATQFEGRSKVTAYRFDVEIELMRIVIMMKTANRSHVRFVSVHKVRKRNGGRSAFGTRSIEEDAIFRTWTVKVRKAWREAKVNRNENELMSTVNTGSNEIERQTRSNSLFFFDAITLILFEIVIERVGTQHESVHF
jgi:hypothetical protein